MLIEKELQQTSQWEEHKLGTRQIIIKINKSNNT